ncbi:hypothetical protein Syun_021025 [Stephania yunnanensis]|uniref:Uncharacterized protein n=1 Tax=Stephania yunnanensis TaxID=152371 RepID=A0AAP0IFU3_9MAGN
MAINTPHPNSPLYANDSTDYTPHAHINMPLNVHSWNSWQILTLGIGHAFSSFIWLCGPITGLVQVMKITYFEKDHEAEMGVWLHTYPQLISVTPDAILA